MDEEDSAPNCNQSEDKSVLGASSLACQIARNN